MEHTWTQAAADDELLTARETASAVGKALRTVYYMVERGELETVELVTVKVVAVERRIPREAVEDLRRRLAS